MESQLRKDSMTRSKHLAVIAALFLAGTASATTFIVPTDEHLVDKASAIVIGTVEASYTQQADTILETVNEIRVERAMKGALRPNELIRVIELGGELESGAGLYVPGSPRYEQGERVLVFLTRDEGRWRTTDMALGRFRFATSTAGERLLVRQMEDVVGWDHHGRPHQEKIRREHGFLQFIDARVAGRAHNTDYAVDASAVTLAAAPRERFEATTMAAPFPARTYVSFPSDPKPGRWENVSAGIRFYKRTDQNLSGLADGGVSVIQNGLAAWTNEPNSNINLIYGGQQQRASNSQDNVNVIEFNDPQNRIGGSWTGAGTVGTTFLWYNDLHEYEGELWWSISDTDVVFQNGYPGTNSALATAMTHELGHALGFRHSDQDMFDGPCNPSTMECTNAAVMFSVSTSAYGYSLQPFDQHAAEAVYPGTGTPTCTPPSITSQPTSRTINPGQSTTLSVTATGTPAFTYQWFVGASGNTSTPIAGGTSSTLTVAPSSTTSYWVRVSNGCGVVNSATATVTVNQPTCTPPSITTQPQSQTINAGSTATLSVNAVGTPAFTYQWFVGTSGNTSTPIASGTTSTITVSPTQTTSYWVRVSNGCGVTSSATATITVNQPLSPRDPKGDFNNDNRTDIFWQNLSTGQTGIWFMNGTATPARSETLTVPSNVWRVVASGDFDGNGTADLLWRNLSTGENTVWLMNNGVPTYGSLPTVSDTRWQVRGAGDFNGDGRGDLLWRHTATGQNVIWFMNGFTHTAVEITQIADLNWNPVAFGYFNDDNRADIFWRNSVTGENTLWFMNGATHTFASMVTVTAANWAPVAAADFNGDGRDDVLWRNQVTGESTMWFINGGSMTAATLETLAPQWVPKVLGDFNGDGRADIFWFNTSTGQTGAWHMNGTTILARYNLYTIPTSWEAFTTR
jgi:FG-GAP-like repeat/Immunoglobulin domain